MDQATNGQQVDVAHAAADTLVVPLAKIQQFLFNPGCPRFLTFILEGNLNKVNKELPLHNDGVKSGF